MSYESRKARLQGQSKKLPPIVRNLHEHYGSEIRNLFERHSYPDRERDLAVKNLVDHALASACVAGLARINNQRRNPRNKGAIRDTRTMNLFPTGVGSKGSAEKLFEELKQWRIREEIGETPDRTVENLKKIFQSEKNNYRNQVERPGVHNNPVNALEAALARAHEKAWALSVKHKVVTERRKYPSDYAPIDDGGGEL